MDLNLHSGVIEVSVTAGFNYTKLYVGPSMLLFGMLGGYFAFFPKRPFTPQQWVRPSTEIFMKKTDQKEAAALRYWVNPWSYVVFFALYQILLQVCLNIPANEIVDRTNVPFLGQLHGWFVGRGSSGDVSAFSPVAAMIAVGCGALLSQVLPMFAVSLKPKRPGGKLQLEVIQHYRELRTLDMTHDQACEGEIGRASCRERV